jgi:hypothetical protein
MKIASLQLCGAVDRPATHVSFLTYVNFLISGQHLGKASHGSTIDGFAMTNEQPDRLGHGQRRGERLDGRKLVKHTRKVHLGEIKVWVVKPQSILKRQ